MRSRQAAAMSGFSSSTCTGSRIRSSKSTALNAVSRAWYSA